MAQQLNAIGIPAPGGQGLNTEQSPFQGGTEFALRADNAVVDRAVSYTHLTLPTKA